METETRDRDRGTGENQKENKREQKEKGKSDQKTNYAKHFITIVFAPRNTVSPHLSWNNSGTTDRKAKREIFAWCPAQLRRWAIWRLGFSSHWLVPLLQD